MSQLVAPSHTAADSIPLGRRITEIMMDKGAAFTISAMAKRLDINRETYRLMLKGEREIYTFELDKIAADLKVPVERILQQDTVLMSKQIFELLNYKSSDFHLGLKLSKQLAEVAIGYTERSVAANNIGTAYYHLRDFDQAVESFEKALPEAKFIMDKYGDAEVFWWLTANILNVRTSKKDYQGVQDVLLVAETFFNEDPRTLAIICYDWAMLLEEWKDDHEGARNKHYQSLANYEQIGNPLSIGRSKHHIALFEYRQNKYDKAIELFHSALEIFRQQDHLYMRVIIGRDYGRALLRMERHQTAAEIISESLAQIADEEYTDLAAQLYLLLAIATDEPQHADQIITESLGSISIQKIAGKFLVEYEERRGDEVAKKQAEQRLEQMWGSPIDLLLPIKSTTPGYLVTLLDLCIQNIWHLR
jgi:tetratricopeptide (TPR) repeat protein